MPLSGGYYYPSVSVQSPRDSLDMRPRATAAVIGNNTGKLYVLSGTDDLYYLDPSGNSMLVASDFSSSADVTGSTNFFVLNTLSVSGSIKNGVGPLILSSSAGSTIAVSSSLDFANVDKNYHINAKNSHLILTGAAGAAPFRVFISGVLTAAGSHELHHLGSGFQDRISFMNSAGTATVNNFSADSNGIHFNSNNLASFNITSLGIRIGALNSAGVQVTQALEVSGSIALRQPDRAVLIASGSHLILSSAFLTTPSIIAISGNLKLDPVFTSANLPTGDVVSGSFVYLSDKKCFAIYTPEGWQRILSATL